MREITWLEKSQGFHFSIHLSVKPNSISRANLERFLWEIKVQYLASQLTCVLCPKHTAGYLFLVNHETLKSQITLHLLGIKLLTFLIDPLQVLLCSPPKQDGIRNRGMVYCCGSKIFLKKCENICFSEVFSSATFFASTPKRGSIWEKCFRICNLRVRAPFVSFMASGRWRAKIIIFPTENRNNNIFYENM